MLVYKLVKLRLVSGCGGLFDMNRFVLCSSCFGYDLCVHQVCKATSSWLGGFAAVMLQHILSMPFSAAIWQNKAIAACGSAKSKSV